MDYSCPASGCTFSGGAPYTTHIPQELYEGHNIATLFCPHCGCALEKKHDGSGEKKTA
jgi:hypothetical protein